MKTINVGSLNIDYVYDVDHIAQRGETISSTSRNVFPGGKGLNQSIALARAGAKVSHVGMVGSEGAFLVSLMAESGVDVDHVTRTADIATGHAIIQHDREGDNCIVLYGGANRRLGAGLVDAAFAECEPGDWVLFQNETSYVGEAIARAKGLGAKVAFNPSPVDAKLFGYPLDLVDCFLLNEIEAAELVQASGSPHELLCAMHEKYPRAQVVLTVGSKGSLYVDASGLSLEQSAFKTVVADTTAAGDTFTGYFLAALQEGRCAGEALARASMAASIAVSRQGAAPSIPLVEEVEGVLVAG